jgi:hypothetical protein
LASLLLLPFLNKPFTIDDPLFLRAAEHALVDPLHPGNFEQVWNAGDRLLLSQFWLGGTMPAYLFVPVAVLGTREWVAHLYQWLFLCAFLLGSVSIARRLGCDRKQASIVGLLVGANPVTLAMAATCMPDTMAAALGIWGLDRTLVFREKRSASAGVAAGVLLAAAVLCRGNAAMLLVVAAILLLPSEWKQSWAFGWPVALSVALAGVWLLLQSGSTSSLQLLTTFRNVPRNLVGFLSFQALAGPLVAYCILCAGWRFAGAAAGLMAVGIGLSFAPSAKFALYAVPAALALCFVLACGFLIGDLRNALPLVVWLGAGLAALPYVQMAAKYLLPGVPAAALLIVLHGARTRQRHYPLIVAVLIALGWIAGAAIIVGDAALAGSQRAAVEQHIIPALRAGKSVWAAGQWAFLGYAERAGAKALANTAPLPQAGDLVAVSRLSYYGRFDQLPLARELVAVFPDRRCGLFVLNRGLSAGFFSTRFGFLPFAVGCGEVDRYDVYRIL